MHFPAKRFLLIDIFNSLFKFSSRSRLILEPSHKAFFSKISFLQHPFHDFALRPLPHYINSISPPRFLGRLCGPAFDVLPASDRFGVLHLFMVLINTFLRTFVARLSAPLRFLLATHIGPLHNQFNFSLPICFRVRESLTKIRADESSRCIANTSLTSLTVTAASKHQHLQLSATLASVGGIHSCYLRQFNFYCSWFPSLGSTDHLIRCSLNFSDRFLCSISATVALLSNDHTQSFPSNYATLNLFLHLFTAKVHSKSASTQPSGLIVFDCMGSFFALPFTRVWKSDSFAPFW